MYIKNQDVLFVEHLLCSGALCIPHSIFPVLWGRNPCPLTPGRWSQDSAASRCITLGHGSSPTLRTPFPNHEGPQDPGGQLAGRPWSPAPWPVVCTLQAFQEPQGWWFSMWGQFSGGQPGSTPMSQGPSCRTGMGHRAPTSRTHCLTGAWAHTVPFLYSN